MAVAKNSQNPAIEGTQDAVISGKAGRPKSVEKREKILSSASDIFLKHGFSATSMDMVASQAGVSKQTVYSHFSNKDTLFSAVIDHKCNEYRFDPEQLFAPEDSPRDVLMKCGKQLVSLLRDPEVINMYRVVMGEVGSNPVVAQLFYDAGPKAGFDMLTNFMVNCPYMKVEKEKAHSLAVAFFNLIKGEHHMKELFGLPCNINSDEIEELVGNAAEHVLNAVGRK